MSRSVGSFGGVVVLGSNSSTSKQTMAAMKAAEIQRAELIDMIDLPAVGRSGLQRAAQPTSFDPTKPPLGQRRCPRTDVPKRPSSR
ncbi:MAG: hypothetical protein WA645_01875, partial [Pseudolabrys sp.]